MTEQEKQDSTNILVGILLAYEISASTMSIQEFAKSAVFKLDLSVKKIDK